MTPLPRTASLVALLGAAGWALLTFRLGAFVLAGGVLIVGAAQPRLGRSPIFIAAALVSAIISPLQPYEITLRSKPGPLQWVSRCVLRGPSGGQAALQQRAEGRGVIATDSTGAFEPEKYLLW